MNEKEEEEKKPVKTIHIDARLMLTNTKTNISTILTNSLDTVEYIRFFCFFLSFFLSLFFLSLFFSSSIVLLWLLFISRLTLTMNWSFTGEIY